MLKPLLIAGLVAVASPTLAADYVHTDGTAYAVPTGLRAFSDARLAASQASFSIERPGAERAGVCVISVSVLNGYANRETWEKMKAAQKADPAAAAARSIKPPEKVLHIDGVRDLALTQGGDGVIYWLTKQDGQGRQQTVFNAIGVIGSRQIYAANCLSEPGLTFTPVELDRISKLVVSVKPQPPPPLPAAQ